MTQTLGLDQYLSVVDISEIDIAGCQNSDVSFLYCINIPEFVNFILYKNEI